MFPNNILLLILSEASKISIGTTPKEWIGKLIPNNPAISGAISIYWISVIT